MCEYKVYEDGRIVYKDILYARKDGDVLILRDALGVEARLEGYEIVEVDTFKEILKIRKKKG